MITKNSAWLLALAITGTANLAWAAGGGSGGGGSGMGTTSTLQTRKHAMDQVQQHKRTHAENAASGAGASNEPVRVQQQERNTVRNEGADKQLRTQDRNRTATQEGKGPAGQAQAASGAASR